MANRSKNSGAKDGADPHFHDRVRKAILDRLAAPDYRPAIPRSLVRELTDDPDQYEQVEKVIFDLVNDGTVVQLKRKGLALARSADLMPGDIRFLRGGNALVSSVGGDRTVFVPRGETGTAMPGDRVLVRLNPDNERRGDREGPSGAVIRVVERRTLTVVGTLKVQRRIHYVKPMHASITHDIIVPDTAGANLGDRVLVRLEEWTEPEMSPEGVIVEIIGPADDPALDTISVIKDANLPTSFPREVLAQAETATVDPAVFGERLDFRKKWVFTIDPATARDFDDAISLEKVTGGKWRLGIHIADVSHFVTKKSPLDKEAYERGNSVYFPDTVIPMLPEQLANGLCSLQPHVDRLAFSVFVTMDDEAHISKVSFAETVIHSGLRLSYEQAMAALETPEGAAYPEAGMSVKAVTILKDVHRLAMTMRRRRFDGGALNMILPDVRFVIGEDGRIDDVVPVPNDESHQLIEECMLLANEEVCKFLCSKDVPHVHRVHEEPDPEDLQELEAMFELAGLDVGDLTDREQMGRLLQQIEGLPQSAAWYGSILRSFKRARYAVPPLGHYGLSKEHYLHFTSPIRRYADLVVHRILKDVLAKRRVSYNGDQLVEISDQCSQREDVAMKAERDLVSMKRTRFFAEQLASGELRRYEAFVSEVRNFGLFIFLPDVQAQGMVHVSQLEDDFFDFNPRRNELVGRATGRRFMVGEPIQVVICKVDEDRCLLDFTVAKDPETEPQPNRARKDTRSQDQRRQDSKREHRRAGKGGGGGGGGSAADKPAEPGKGKGKRGNQVVKFGEKQMKRKGRKGRGR